MTRTERRRYWEALIQEQQRSGQSVLAFCRQQRLSQSSFYYWRKRFRHQAMAKVTADPGFVELRRPEFGTGVELRAGGFKLQVEPGFDSETLRRVLGILQEFER